MTLNCRSSNTRRNQRCWLTSNISRKWPSRRTELKIRLFYINQLQNRCFLLKRFLIRINTPCFLLIIYWNPVPEGNSFLWSALRYKAPRSPPDGRFVPVSLGRPHHFSGFALLGLKITKKPLLLNKTLHLLELFLIIERHFLSLFAACLVFWAFFAVDLEAIYPWDVGGSQRNRV